MNRINVLFACLLTPLAALAGEYRAIVEVEAMTDHPMHAGPDEKVLYTYKPGEPVETTRTKACSAAACEVLTPDGDIAWVLSYKITEDSDLAAEQESFGKIPWGKMTDEDIFYWAMYKEEPVFGHACAMALAGGEFKIKDDIETLCTKVRNTRQVQEASTLAEKAIKSMGDQDQDRLLNGGAPIGAPKGAVYLAWGKPRDTKRTITKDMVAERIIYEERVAHIENGILTMIEE